MRRSFSPPDGSILDFIDLGRARTGPKHRCAVWGSESLVIARHVPASLTTHGDTRRRGMSTTGFTDDLNWADTAENKITSSSDDHDRENHEFQV